MIVLWILLLLLLFLLLYLLFAPFYLEIDTTQGLFRVRFHVLASASLVLTAESPSLDLNLAGFHKRVRLFAPAKESGAMAEKKKQGTGRIKKPGRKKNPFPVKKILSMGRSFRVNKCHVAVCFQDMTCNGILYPLFEWICFYTGRDIGINFIGNNEVILEVENNFARMIRAAVKSK